MTKSAPVDHPIHALLRDRWSPYGFIDKEVTREDLRSLFEAARWAPSCFNEQPWRFVVATRDNSRAFERLLSCLTEANRVWARLAPVLVLGIARKTFARNAKLNRHAVHDLGLAAGNLCLEATARGLAVHQMGGILPDRARELYGVPGDFEIVTGMAIGYPGDAARLPDEYRQRDETRRGRSTLDSFVYEDGWGTVASIVAPR